VVGNTTWNGLLFQLFTKTSSPKDADFFTCKALE